MLRMTMLQIFYLHSFIAFVALDILFSLWNVLSFFSVVSCVGL